MAQGRNWLFTLNNPETNDLPEDWKHMRFRVYQRERGDAGTEHLQGYVEFTKPVRLVAVRELLPRAHWERRRGTQDQARDYCSKEDTRIDGPWIFGELPRQGCRNDLQAVRDLIDGGAPEMEIAQTHFGAWCRYGRAFREYKRLRAEHRNFKTEVRVYWGPPGTGKSRRVMEESPDAYWKPGNCIWFDDYDGGSDVVLDDFYGWLPWSTLLNMLDRYPMKVQTKGGMVNFCPKRIFITSNKPPEEWYSNPHDMQALLRRIDFIEQMN